MANPSLHRTCAKSRAGRLSQTLNRTKINTPQHSVSPRAVALARVFLLFVGFACLAIAGGIWAGEISSPAWWVPFAVAAAGIALALSAVFEAPSSVVGTFLIFFFPWY